MQESQNNVQNHQSIKSKHLPNMGRLSHKHQHVYIHNQILNSRIPIAKTAI
jgi:hypothetical protein